MVLKKKILKGVRGVISSKDLEKYLEQILILERKLRQKDIAINMLEAELIALKQEHKKALKDLHSHEKNLQEHRNINADIKLKLQSLKDQKELLEREKQEAVGGLRKELDHLPDRSEYEKLKNDHQKTLKKVKSLENTLDRRDSQVRKLTEENLKLKDKLKFIKSQA